MVNDYATASDCEIFGDEGENRSGLEEASESHCVIVAGVDPCLDCDGGVRLGETAKEIGASAARALQELDLQPCHSWLQ
jgi:hypothetical protein